MRENNNTKYAIMMIGKTHSGKTTFAQQLEKKCYGVVIQTDPISLFLKNNFSHNLNLDKEHDGTFKNISLKYKLFKEIVNHTVQYTNLIPILSNSNMHQKARTEMINYLRESGCKVIGIYLNFDETLLLKRIEASQRDTSSLNFINNFKEVLVRQRDLFIIPKRNEFDYFFEIDKEEELLNHQDKILSLLEYNLLQ